MASRNYNVGNGTDQISITVTTGTAASCSTTINQMLSGGQKKIIANSAINNNGAIDTCNIGLPTDVVNTSISIQTIADFRALPDDVITAISADQHALKTNLMVEYTFNGGTLGEQVFDWDYDDIVLMSNVAMVTKIINLIN